MKQIIESVLQRHQDQQINLASKAARKSLAEEIALVLTDRGTYTEYGDDEIGRKSK
jgi:ABC-type tungstate transport system permease subunit